MIYSISKKSVVQSDTNPTLIMLHGRGADENDLFGLSQYFDVRLSIHSLRAPLEYEWGGYTWFELFEDGSVDEQSFLSSKDHILEYISSLDSKNIILLGFSMGAIMAYALALTQPNMFTGIACLSGFAPMRLENEYKLSALGNLSIFISHGINDPVIPVSFAQKTKQLLDTSNAVISYHEYPMGHEIGEECTADVKSWIHSLLG